MGSTGPYGHLKAKCTNCGAEMEQHASPNWQPYCSKPECIKAFYASIANMGKKK